MKRLPLVAALAFTACSGRPAPSTAEPNSAPLVPDQPAATEADAPPPSEPADGIELLSAGDEPRQALRYDFTSEPVKRALSIHDVTHVDYEDPKSSPETEDTDLVVIATTQPTEADGSRWITYRRADAEEVSLRVRVSPRGIVLDRTKNMGKVGPDKQFRPLQRAGALLALPVFPGGEIGVGARWRVARPVEQYTNAPLDVWFVYELLAFDQGVATIGITYDLSATSVAMATFDPPNSGIVHSIESHGTGRATVSLSRPIPTASELTKLSDGDFEVKLSDVNMRLKIRMDYTIRLDAP